MTWNEALEAMERIASKLPTLAVICDLWPDTDEAADKRQIGFDTHPTMREARGFLTAIPVLRRELERSEANWGAFQKAARHRDKLSVKLAALEPPNPTLLDWAKRVVEGAVANSGPHELAAANFILQRP